MAELAVSVDIGSTWTKGALVDLGGGRLVARSETPTTTDDLSKGFKLLWDPLARKARAEGRKDFETFLSSSAKGGLRIAAIGIVPDLTLKAAKLAAASAGGKVVATYAYRLKSRDIDSLLALSPDLILIAGGTDGGDESYARANAALLASSAIGAAYVYAGNAAVRDEVLATLRASGKRAVGAENILPELDRFESEDARKAIAELFLERIIEGRGLQAVRSLCSAEPRPTPAAVFDLVRILDGRGPGERRGGLLVVDMGGATTDVYSAGEAFAGAADTVYRGIPEPRIKRTVEGDLGLRVSARNLLEAALPQAEQALGGDGKVELSSWVETVSADQDRLPRTERERALDAFLGRVCVAESVRRHAGSVEGIYTATGLVWVQRGKDLSKVGVAIGTGGALAREGSGRLFRAALADEGSASSRAGRSLMPDGKSIRYFRDAEYILPLAANLAAKHEDAAADLAIAGLMEDRNGDTV